MSLPNPEQARWFTEEVQQHEPALRRYLRGRFPRLRDVDDLVQEAYARLFRARRTHAIVEPRAYLFSTARNAALDHYRRNRIVSAEDLGEIDLESVVEDRPNAADDASHAQELELLTQAVESLPQRCREVLKLRRYHGLSYRDIGERLGISESTVNAQLAIAMRRCRQHLRIHGLLNRDNHVISS